MANAIARLQWPTPQFLYTLLICLTVLLAGNPAHAAGIEDVVVERSRSVAPDRDADPVLNNLERRTFRFF